MILQYIEKALSHAQYEIIEEKTPYYGEVPELAGGGQPVRLSKTAGRTSLKSSKAGSLSG
jgi:hypothetical protein